MVNTCTYLSYGCEVWVLRSDEIELLRKFQRMIGRRCQRLPPNSPNYSAYSPLGWMSLTDLFKERNLCSLERFLYLTMTLLVGSLEKPFAGFAQDRNKSKLKEFDSPIFDLLNTSLDVGLYELCMNMIHRHHIFSKTQWRKLVWDAVWSKEDGDCLTWHKSMSEKPTLFKIIDKSYYLIWWILSDNIPNMMGICEKMAALVCDSSLLKAHDVRLKRESFWMKTCTGVN